MGSNGFSLIDEFLDGYRAIEDNRPTVQRTYVLDRYATLYDDYESPKMRRVGTETLRVLVGYRLQMDGLQDATGEIPPIILNRYKLAMIKKETEMSKMTMEEQVQELNDKIAACKSNAWLKRYKAQLEKIVAASHGLYEIRDDVAVAVKPASLKPRSAALKPSRSTGPNGGKIKELQKNKEARWDQWLKEGGRRVDIPAHNETSTSGTIISHKAYYYVLPPAAVKK